MKEQNTKPFQILALSGGGFRGLYTAKILADIERDLGGASIASRFDLIAGTSVGGILALAIALEIPAQKIVDLFVNRGEDIFKRRAKFGIFRSLYTADVLKDLLSGSELFGNRLLGSCRHPVIIPSISYSTGKPVIFKTPHHESFKRDHENSLVDIALATSAAPAFFPRHVFNSNQYVDGGLYANAPGLLALHEAEKFFSKSVKEIRLLSIGTMSSKFTVDPNKNRNGGLIDWGGPSRLFGLTISVQESLTDFMLQHRLEGRYLHVDDDLTDQRAHAVALDKVDKAAREVLLGSASERSKACIGAAAFQEFMKYQPSPPIFYYGENTTQEKQPC